MRTTTAKGSAHYNWKGDAVQHGQLHAWLRVEMRKVLPLKCTKCGSTKRVEVANLRGHVYTRNVEDYTFLCKKCHNEFDGLLNNLKQGVESILNSPARNPRITTKVCAKCKLEKLLSEFYKDKQGYRFECIKCNLAIKRAATLAITGAPRVHLYEEISKGVRTCRKCGTTKSLSEFPRKNSKSGTASHCHDCHNKTARSKYVKASIENSQAMRVRVELACGVRTCKGCGIKKPVSEFLPNGNTTRTLCKSCYYVHTREIRRRKKHTGGGCKMMDVYRENPGSFPDWWKQTFDGRCY